MAKKKLGILVSGSGTNLQAIINACKKKSYPAQIAVVISNNPEAFALTRAQKAKIPTLIVPHKDFSSRENFEEILLNILKEHRVDFVVLAGFMRMLSPFFVKKWRNKILNIHPSLLPSFPGTHAIQQAYDSGVKVTGVTVHFVDEGMDTGPIILQEAVPVPDSFSKLEKIIHAVEHRLFPTAIQLVSEKKIRHVGRPMKKILGFLLALSLLTVMKTPAEARQGFSVGVGPVGNIYLIDTLPILDPGIGGHVYFNYRFAEQVAFETTFLITSQNGTKVSSADKGILFLGMPTLDLKYYFLKDDPQWDPYAVLGIGMYWVTEGSVSNSTGGLGLGAQMGLGFDYYLSEQISLGFSGIFRSVGLITDFGTPSASTALFPFSLMGNVAFHF